MEGLSFAEDGGITSPQALGGSKQLAGLKNTFTDENLSVWKQSKLLHCGQDLPAAGGGGRAGRCPGAGDTAGVTKGRHKVTPNLPVLGLKPQAPGPFLLHLEEGLCVCVLMGLAALWFF